jgi:hypothetical protein
MERRGTGGPTTVPLTWPVSKDMAERMRILWPIRVNPGRPNLDNRVNRIKSGMAAHVGSSTRTPEEQDARARAISLLEA